MNNTIEYKGYIGSVEYSQEDDILHGKVLGIRDLVNYEGKTVDELRKDFQDAVESYLSVCAELGQAPEEPYSGSFQVDVDPELHKQLMLYSRVHQMSMNSVVESAFRQFVAAN